MPSYTIVLRRDNLRQNIRDAAQHKCLRRAFDQ